MMTKQQLQRLIDKFLKVCEDEHVSKFEASYALDLAAKYVEFDEALIYRPVGISESPE